MIEGIVAGCIAAAGAITSPIISHHYQEFLKN